MTALRRALTLHAAQSVLSAFEGELRWIRVLTA